MWDALIALSFVFLILAGFISLQYFRSQSVGGSEFERIHYVSEDAMEVMNKQGVLRELGYLWSAGNYSNVTQLQAGNFTGASSVVRNYLELFIPYYLGYRLEVEGDVIYDSQYDTTAERPSESTASEETRAVRIVSGYSRDRAAEGWVARSWLEENTSGLVTQLSYDGEPHSFLTINYPGDSDTAYLRLPLGSRVSTARLNLSWDLSVVSPTSSTTTSTTLPSEPCTQCPSWDCPLNIYSHDAPDITSKYYYFYSSGNCNATVTLYTNVIGSLGPDYELFVRWNGSCPVYDESQGDEVTCNSRNYRATEVCSKEDLDTGVYYVMSARYRRDTSGTGTYNITVDLDCP